jgi:hypothetical protein
MILQYCISQMDFTCGIKIPRSVMENVIHAFKYMKCAELTCHMLREIEIS